MRNLFQLGIAMSALFALSTALSSAQCSGTFTTMTVNCAGPKGYTNTVFPQYPDEPDQFGATIECTGLNCCGQLISSCGPGGSFCPGDGVRDRRVRAEIAKLATTADLLELTAKAATSPTI